MIHGVGVISENYEILLNFVNTKERLNRNLLVVNNELPQQLLLLFQDKI